MELNELYHKTLDLFGAKDVKNLGDCLMKSLNDEEKKDAFCEMVGGDLSKDWLQMIYQYYLADRKGKKQDYTPSSIAKLMGALVGCPDSCIDLCAGSGALAIQKWLQNPNQEFVLYEIDINVIPYLLFNLAARNISATVFLSDVLQGDIKNKWKINKGEKYATVSNIKSTL